MDNDVWQDGYSTLEQHTLDEVWLVLWIYWRRYLHPYGHKFSGDPQDPVCFIYKGVNICLSKLNLSSMWTPRSFSHEVYDKCWFSISYIWLSFPCLVPKLIDTHLSWWKRRSHVFYQFTKLFTSACSCTMSSSDWICLNTFVSSANK